MTNEPLKATHTPLPCPFCGCPFVRVSVPVDPRFKRSVNCPSCHSHGGWGNDDAEALTAWNTRAVNSHHDLIEALREAMSALAWIGGNCDDRAATRRADDAYDNIVEAFPGLPAILTKAEAGQ